MKTKIYGEKLISLNVFCGQHRSKAAKIQEVIAHDKVIAHDTLSE
jgi:hypothetical protein